MDKRALAAEYFVKALSTGERTAAARLEPMLAADVEFDTNSQPGVPPIEREVFRGKAAVLERVSGIWPATPGYGRLGWSSPEADGDGLLVRSSGAVTVAFSFNERDEITRAYLDGGWGSGKSAPPQPSGQVEEIPLFVRGIINNARNSSSPMIVTYVSEEGEPRSSFRGSVVVIGPRTVAFWARNAEGGLPTAISTHPVVSLVLANMAGGAMLNITGRARIATDEETRRQVYENGPEVEQLHDLERKGAAVVIDVTSLQGFVSGSPISLTPAAS